MPPSERSRSSSHISDGVTLIEEPYAPHTPLDNDANDGVIWNETPNKHLLNEHAELHQGGSTRVWYALGLLRRICTACSLTSLLLVAVVSLSSYIIFTLIVGSYAYKKAFYVQEGHCYGRGHNTPFKWLPNTDCPYYDKVPQQKWEQYYYNNNSDVVRSVSIPNKDSSLGDDWKKLSLSAWFYNGSRQDPGRDPVPFAQRAVVMVHGIRCCKEQHTVLLPSAMLHRQGFHVLNIDLRNHGNSFRDNWGTVTFGSSEHWDVYSAVEWLKEHTGLDSDAIGVFGVSMGAATTLVAWGRDRTIPALWADSPPCDIANVMQHNMVGTLLSFSGDYILWTTCQAAPIWDNYGCIPWKYDPLATSKLNITEGAHGDKLDALPATEESQPNNPGKNDDGKIDAAVHIARIDRAKNLRGEASAFLSRTRKLQASSASGRSSTSPLVEGKSDKSTQYAFSRSVHFEHTLRDFIVPLDNSNVCLSEVNKTANFVSNHVGYDNSSVPPKYPRGRYIPCDHHVKTMLADTDSYETRLVSFFMEHLRESKN